MPEGKCTQQIQNSTTNYQGKRPWIILEANISLTRLKVFLCQDNRDVTLNATTVPRIWTQRQSHIPCLLLLLLFALYSPTITKPAVVSTEVSLCKYLSKIDGDSWCSMKGNKKRYTDNTCITGNFFPLFWRVFCIQVSKKQLWMTMSTLQEWQMTWHTENQTDNIVINRLLYTCWHF